MASQRHRVPEDDFDGDVVEGSARHATRKRKETRSLTWTLGLNPSGGLACPSVALADLGDCAVPDDGDLFPRSRVLFPALCVLLELIT